MGDDAEFQIEFEKYGPWWEDLDRDAEPEGLDDPEYSEGESFYGGQPLVLVTENAREAVWGWNESVPLPVTLSDLHSRWGLGRSVFLASGLPAAGRRQPEADDCSSEKLVFEVMVLSHDDEVVLEAAASALTALDQRLADRLIGGMLLTMLDIIQASPRRDEFTFALSMEPQPFGIYQRHRADGER